MNIYIGFLNSLPRFSNILNLQQFLVLYVHNSYFIVYPVKMVDTTFETESINSVSKKSLRSKIYVLSIIYLTKNVIKSLPFKFLM